MYPSGLIALGGYLPAKPVPPAHLSALIEFLEQETLLPREYVATLKQTGCLPGSIETNYDGWESQPWFPTWLERLPPKKRADPFQGTVERRRVPVDPLSECASAFPHPMLPSDAETLAGALALVNAGLGRADVDLILVHSQVPDLPLPDNASLVQHKLQLPSAGAYSMDTCCSSFVTMLETAHSYIRSGMKRRVLIVSSYLDSHVLDRTEYFSVCTGDAALAGVVTRVEDSYGYITSHSTSHGNRHKAIIFERRPPTLYRPAPGVSYTQEFTTFADQEMCKEIATNAQRDMVEVVTLALEKARLDMDAVDFLVTHQPVVWAGHAWREALGLPPEKFYESFERYGNIATCAAGVNLLEAVEYGHLQAGDQALIASSGAGENHIAVLERLTPTLIANNLLASSSIGLF
jgi:3-oxoacyl-[acyl-carrier-protein] synthase-3